MREPEPFVWIVVPMVAPSVNHYVKHTRDGRHYVSKEAKAFKELVWVTAARRKVRAKAYQVEATIYQGKADRGDVDNYGKVLLDSLVYAGCIDTDAKVSDIILHKRRDRDNPRTEIFVKGLP